MEFSCPSFWARGSHNVPMRSGDLEAVQAAVAKAPGSCAVLNQVELRFGFVSTSINLVTSDCSPD